MRRPAARHSFSLSAIAACLLLAACGSDGGTEPPTEQEPEEEESATEAVVTFDEFDYELVPRNTRISVRITNRADSVLPDIGTLRIRLSVWDTTQDGERFLTADEQDLLFQFRDMAEPGALLSRTADFEAGIDWRGDYVCFTYERNLGSEQEELGGSCEDPSLNAPIIDVNDIDFDFEIIDVNGDPDLQVTLTNTSEHHMYRISGEFGFSDLSTSAVLSDLSTRDLASGETRVDTLRSNYAHHDTDYRCYGRVEVFTTISGTSPPDYLPGEDLIGEDCWVP